jgi:hypothetical protein
MLSDVVESIGGPVPKTEYANPLVIPSFDLLRRTLDIIKIVKLLFGELTGRGVGGSV